jgi:hypothetical protein
VFTPKFVGLATIIVVSSEIPSGTVLNSFSVSYSNLLPEFSFAIISTQPATSNFVLQPLSPNAGIFMLSYSKIFWY